MIPADYTDFAAQIRRSRSRNGANRPHTIGSLSVFVGASSADGRWRAGTSVPTISRYCFASATGSLTRPVGENCTGAGRVTVEFLADAHSQSATPISTQAWSPMTNILTVKARNK